MRKSLLLLCFFSSLSFAYPIIYTVDGVGSTSDSQPDLYTFTTTFMIDTDQVGQRYIDGAEQDVAGSWYASLLTFSDSSGTTFSFSGLEDGDHYVAESPSSSGLAGVTAVHLGDDFKISLIAFDLYSQWQIGQHFEIYANSDRMSSGRIVAISSSVPEPGSLSLLLAGMGGLIVTRRFRR